MPVLVWEQTEDGPRASVETDWQTLFTPEEVREEAEELDRNLDAVLDSALEESRTLSRNSTPIEFARAWSIGKSLRDSGVLESHALRNEPRATLWLALARKCRTGIRSDRTRSPEWADLRPSTAREPRREGRRLDHFELSLWLADQTFDAAAETFGGSIRNAWQMLERPTLRPPVVRRALSRWLNAQDFEARSRAVEPAVFAELMKALRARWPDRGAGSAKRPIHFTEDELLRQMSEVLSPVLKEVE
jgi:hypothetical protein